MKQIKKFRKNNWSDEEEVVTQRKHPGVKRFDRALKTRDIDYLSHYDDED